MQLSGIIHEALVGTACTHAMASWCSTAKMSSLII